TKPTVIQKTRRSSSWSGTPLRMSPIIDSLVLIAREAPATAEIALRDTVTGFVGGAIGVTGTLIALDSKKVKVAERAKCPYCTGDGRLTCVRCLGAGMLPAAADGGAACKCGFCEGKGFVTCVNCKGDGRAVPLMLNRKASRDPESELEDVGII
ncbi:unnamed protein product, partial [Heterosigma akashiwo]